MNQNNALSLLLGTVIGGVATYFVIKNQDEISDKISDLKDSIHFDHHELLNSAKGKLDQLTTNLQSMIQRYTHSGETTIEKSDELATIMEELNRLSEEVKALRA